MDDDIEERLETYADRADISLDEAKDHFEAKLEEMEETWADGVSEKEKKQSAAMTLTADVQAGTRVEGKTEEFPILALGHGGERELYGRGDGVIAFGIINPNEGGIINDPPESDPAGLAVFSCEEDRGADLGRIRKLFSQPRLNTLKGWFSRQQASDIQWKGVMGDDGQARPVYDCRTTTDTKVEEVDPESDEIQLPTSMDAKRKLINSQYITEQDQFTLATFMDNLSATNSDGYPANNGADLKRFRGQIVEAQRDDSPEKDYGRLTLIDDSVADLEKLPEAGLDVGMEGSAIGLTVWLPPEMVEYGVGSIVDVYGTLSPNREGDILMNGVSVIPIAPKPYQDDQSNGSEAQKQRRDNVNRKSL